MNNELLTKIKSRGYWHVLVRPERFIVDRIPSLRECEELVEKNLVRHRGWYFPHIEPRDVSRGLDYIEVAVTFVGSVHEAWRLYQSGQFAFFGALREDWMQEDTWFPPQVKPDMKSGTVLDILSTLYQLSEIYEFATRLAQTGLFDDRLFLAVNITKTERRRLFFWSGERFLWEDYVCRIPEIPRQATFDTADLIARSREFSLRHFLWLVERFGMQASVEVFRRDQEKFFEGRF